VDCGSVVEGLKKRKWRQGPLEILRRSDEVSAAGAGESAKGQRDDVLEF